MNKSPAFQFYVKDWLSDSQLRMASPSTRGIWIDVLCFMWTAPEKGKITFDSHEIFARMVGANIEEIRLFIAEANSLSFCDISVMDNNTVTVCNRRMQREEKERKNNRDRQRRFREKQSNNEKVTPLSSTASASAKKKTIQKESSRFSDFWEAYPNKTGKKPCEIKWKSRKLDRLADTIIADIRNRIENDRKWVEGFIPNPLTYINQDRWNDQIEPLREKGQPAVIDPEIEAARKKANIPKSKWY